MQTACRAIVRVGGRSTPSSFFDTNHDLVRLQPLVDFNGETTPDVLASDTDLTDVASGQNRLHSTILSKR